MAETSIEWTDFTLNPGIYGCSRFGVGCDNCYAIPTAKSIERRAHGDTPYTGVSDGADWIGPIRIDPIEKAVARILSVPRARNGERRWVFVTSMADFLHAAVPLDWIVACIEAMAAKPDHRWQVLTKRGQRWPEVADAVVAKLGAWPRNVWAGLSVAHQPDTRLIPYLLAVPAAVRFLSVEPLVGPVDVGACLLALDWIIVGGESGPNARPVNPAWVRSLRDQCRSAGVPFFFKQWGEWAPAVLDDDTDLTDVRIWRTWKGPEGDACSGGAEASRRVGKRAAGRILDGREWSGVPRG